MALSVAQALDGKLGEDVVVFDVRGHSPVSDFVVLATGTSTPHLVALAEAAEAALKEAGGRLHHREGEPASGWMLLDAHAVLVHVFDAASRTHYDFEHLLQDSVRLGAGGRPAAGPVLRRRTLRPRPAKKRPARTRPARARPRKRPRR